MSLLGLLPSDYHKLGGLNSRHLCCSVLEAAIPRSRCRQGQAPLLDSRGGPGPPPSLVATASLQALPPSPVAACALGSDFPRPSPVSLPLFFSWLCRTACGILVPQPGLELGVEKAPSPKHWPTEREFPLLSW